MTLGVQDKKPYEELTWKLTDSDDGKETGMKVAISVSDSATNVGGNLEKMAEVLSKGISELVLEVSPEAEG